MRVGLLAAAVACALVAAQPAAAAVHPIGDGAWSWFGDPRAVTYTGDHTRTYVGWIDGEGDVKVSSYDHTSGARVTAVLQARLNQDDHANPSIQVRPDGRLVVYYSRHVGPAMHYRVSSAPEDVSSWGPPQSVPTNVAGTFGYTYPNPIRLAGEGATYLFWRGGNYNPTFSVQADGATSWSAARTLIRIPGERPYVKYDSSGGDTVHMAYTNAHPGEFPDVNIYYARIRAGKIERVGGQQIGALADDPITPGEGDVVYNGAAPAWVHDVAADSAGRPVIVFATLNSSTDHRYHYANWTGSEWNVHEITPAGGTFREDGGSPYYSGGLTLDHENPNRVYLSRQVGAGLWQVETWTTTDDGASWPSKVVNSGPGKNVRPVSPRGMSAFGGDMSLIWFRGAYPDYLTYDTQIDALMAGADVPPVADAEPAMRSGRSPLEVHFDATSSRDPDGSITGYAWDFGDGSFGTGADPTHVYTSSGRYFPKLTVTDDDGATSVFVDEIVVDLPAPPTAYTGGASGTTVHGTVVPENQATSWNVEYGPTAEYGAVTTAQSLPGDSNLHRVSASLPGVQAGRLYHYRIVADNPTGSTTGEDRVLVAGATPGSDRYRDAVLGTAGVAAYWRLGELSGAGSDDAASAIAGAFVGRYVLGQPGVLGPLRDTSTRFDGVTAERTQDGPVLSGDATLEGWFRWESGTAVLRDNTMGSPNGWILAFSGSGGNLVYRLGGQNFNTGQPVGTVRDGEWHHLVATLSGTTGRLYVDGQLFDSGTGSGGDASTGTWHLMRNGGHTVYSAGEADEIALYTRALSASEVSGHFALAQDLADDPLPSQPVDRVDEPPAAGTGQDGGVLGSFPAPESSGPPRGPVAVSGRRLVIRGAPGVRNRLVARRRGSRWLVSDGLARLRAGRGCRQVRPRLVSCRAAGVRRIVIHGGAGNDRMTVIGRILVSFRGGPGRDVSRRLRAR